MTFVGIVSVAGGGFLMGKLTKNHGEWICEDPRLLQPVRDNQGSTGVGFMELIGHPRVVNLGSEIVYFLPVDKDILDGYTESTTNIKIVGGMTNLPPPPGRGN